MTTRTMPKGLQILDKEPVDVANPYTGEKVTLQPDAVAPLDDTNDVYVDDEGLLKNPNRYFKYGQRTLAGMGLILSHDDEGESVGTTLNSAEVFENVKFLPEGHTEEPYMEFFEVRS